MPQPLGNLGARKKASMTTFCGTSRAAEMQVECYARVCHTEDSSRTRRHMSELLVVISEMYPDEACMAVRVDHAYLGIVLGSRQSGSDDPLALGCSIYVRRSMLRHRS
jgi:hypothetical protein